jgi:hypothetical protein
VGWAFCGGIIAVGRQLTTMDRTLIIHALGAPVGFAVITWFYYRKFGFTAPLQTALLFLMVVLALDVLVVALLLERSFAMFRSPLGTWVPLALIFLSTWVTGLVMKSRG